MLNESGWVCSRVIPVNGLEWMDSEKLGGQALFFAIPEKQVPNEGKRGHL